MTLTKVICSLVFFCHRFRYFFYGLSGLCCLSVAAGEYTVYGPESFVRSGGSPVTETRQIPGPLPEINYFLRLYNGGLEDDDVTGDKVSSGVITVNGVTVVNQSNFGQGFQTLEFPIETPETLSVRLNGKPGGVVTAVIIGIDSQPPTITPSITPDANASGWHRGETIVSFTCDDAISGIASCSESVSITQEGAAQEVTGTATDLAGNSATATVIVNLDDTAPQITYQTDISASATGWYNQAVTLSYTCSDNLSGVIYCPTDQTLAEEGNGQVVTVQAIDVADNTATSTVSLNIDKTAPEINVQLTPQANAAGWFNSDVSLAFSCNDALSGVASCPNAQLVSSEGQEQVVRVTATDYADNNGHTEVVLNIDKTPPLVEFISPLDGAVVVERRPVIQLRLSDNFSLDAASISLTVNGMAAGSCAVGSNDAVQDVQCTLSQDLPLSDSNLQVTVSDRAGNQSSGNITTHMDTDSDGVFDHQDQCLATPGGEAVDGNGCSATQLDDDNDGVSNAIDQCPSTLPGVLVAEDGCDDTQRDTDKDGVIDIEDAFPEDPSESSDLDGDGVGDNSDPDKDGDGMPNDWEAANGLDPGNAEDADLDSDNDGVSNLNEYLAGSDPQDPTDCLSSDCARNTLPAAITEEGAAYVGQLDGNFYKLAEDGTVLWFKEIGLVYGLPVIAPNGHIYAGSNNGNLYELNPQGEILWRQPARGAIIAGPTLSHDGNTLYVLTRNGWLYGLDLISRQLLWELNLAPPEAADMVASPSLTPLTALAQGVPDYLYLRDSQNNLYAIDLSSVGTTGPIVAWVKKLGQ